MNKYTIEIQETLSRIIEIEASSAEEAIYKVKQMYREEEIVLGGDDYVLTEIEEYEG